MDCLRLGVVSPPGAAGVASTAGAVTAWAGVSAAVGCGAWPSAGGASAGACSPAVC